MNKRTAGTLTLIASFCFWFTGCTPTQECGTWVFTGTPIWNTFPMTSAFTFTPADCGKTCKCNTDVMIQMVWMYDDSEHKNIYASDQPQGARSDADGWSIDRVDGAAHGYYGLQNDGTFYSGWNIPGSNGTANTLKDTPGPPANTYFYAVDVAVCYDSKTCKNKILGYYFWSYILDNADIGQTFITAPAWKGLDTEFQDALAAWNAWAPSSGPESDGTDGWIVSAIAFPALSDL
jgi:hypothetical protein